MNFFQKLVLVLFASVSISATAQEWTMVTGSFQCGPFREIVRKITEEKFDEMPLWVGQSGSDATSFVVFLNTKQGNFTVLQYYKDRACVLGLGETSNIVNLAPFREKH